MAFSNYRKESSERSDSKNWAKKQLIDAADYFYESIEGCNQNSYNITTMILERLRVDCVDGVPSSDGEVKDAIVNAEGGRDHLLRKFNFAKVLHCDFYYVLYCMENQMVWLYSIKPNDFHLAKTFSSINDFSKWISENKGWGSKKAYHKNDLPEFDKQLRNCDCGCPWPSNIDCIVFNKEQQPIAIIEYQNADDTTVIEHSNNYRFLYGQTRYNNITKQSEIDEDLRRWKTQEIVRLQGNLRFFILTWDEKVSDYIIKEVERITFPECKDKADEEKFEEYKKLFHRYVNATDKSERSALGLTIMNESNAYYLSFDKANHKMKKRKLTPVLSYSDKSFPLIYYKFKQTSFGYPNTLPTVFHFFIEGIFTTDISK